MVPETLPELRALVLLQNKKKKSQQNYIQNTAVCTANAVGIAGIAYSVPTEDIGGGGSTGGAGVP